MDSIFHRFPHLRDIFGSDLPLCELGPGKPRQDKLSMLRRLDDATLFAGQSVTDPTMARCCYAGLWLLFDFLDESHQISQEIDAVEGSYWHGIMHRREPDYGNAKYWFRRVPRHPVFEPLAVAARGLAAQGDVDGAAEFLQCLPNWDSMAFVDLCQQIAQGKSSSEGLARKVAQREWELLFEHCYGRAIAE